MTRSNILLMTSTIAPQPDTHALARSDPKLRLDDYLQSLEFYLDRLSEGVFDKLVYVDNSGHSLAALEERAKQKGVSGRCEFVSYESEIPSKFSRYFLEANLLLEAFARSSALSSDPEATIWKITGRYIIENIATIVESQPEEFDIYLNLRNLPYRVVDFYLVGSRGGGLERLIKTSLEEFRTSEDGEPILRHKIDEGVYNALNIAPRLRKTPKLRGVRGFDGSSYDGVSYAIKYQLRVVLNRIFPWIWV